MKKQKQTALDLSACHEIQIHYKRPVFDTEMRIENFDSAVEILRAFIDKDRIDHKEFFWVMLLSNANQVLGVSEIAVGNTQGVVVNYKEILQLALLTNASAIIVAHNHPSGKLKPSAQDLNVTQKLQELVKILDITLLDHIIITTEGAVSIVEHNTS